METDPLTSAEAQRFLERAVAHGWRILGVERLLSSAAGPILDPAQILDLSELKCEDRLAAGRYAAAFIAQQSEPGVLFLVTCDEDPPSPAR